MVHRPPPVRGTLPPSLPSNETKCSCRQCMFHSHLASQVGKGTRRCSHHHQTGASAAGGVHVPPNVRPLYTSTLSSAFLYLITRALFTSAIVSVRERERRKGRKLCNGNDSEEKRARNYVCIVKYHVHSYERAKMRVSKEQQETTASERSKPECT